MKYLLFAFVGCGCVLRAPEPKQRTDWVSPPTKYGEVTVEGQKDPSAPASSADTEQAAPSNTNETAKSPTK
ncbi:MAG TPA: hypothetical protein VF881_08640 [Polyangiaceae bacterium]